MIMKFNPLHNFISPVTGKIPVDKGYIIIGDKDGRSIASPVLIDIRQDIIDLRRKIGNFEELKKLDHNRIWIGDYTNQPEERLQIGIINLPTLAEAVFPNPLSPITGDFRIPNPTFDYLSPFDWVMSGPFLPQIYATKYDTFGNPVGTDVSSSLAMTQVRAAQIMKRFDNANFIVGSSTVDFNWENPKMYLIPEALKQLYGLGTTYTFTKAQSLGALETGLLKNTVNNGSGTLSRAIQGKDYVDVAAPVDNMQLALIRPLVQDDQGNDISKFVSRIDKLPTANMPNLSSGKVWQGDVNNRPVEIVIELSPNDATYILQRPNANLPNSQALSSISGLSGGILKCNSLGVVSIASGGGTPFVDDYVDPLTLQTQIAETKAFATAEAAAAEAAAIAASYLYFNEQMLPYSLIPLVPVGVSISGAIGVAVAAAASAQSSANTAISRIDNLTVNLIGDVIGTNLISNPVVTAFIPNPRFTGKGYMKIPTGTTAERPSISETGMLRYNIEI